MNIVITGAAGTIGTVLRAELGNAYDCTLIDIDSRITDEPNGIVMDVATEYDRLTSVLSDADAVIHLAWDVDENFRSEEVIPENKRMAENVYRAATEADVPKVIMASSIHAAGVDPSNTEPFSVRPDAIQPDSPYGATKCYIEALGRWYAEEQGLDVAAIRFGGVNPEDRRNMPDEPGYERIYLSHQDCGNLLRHILDKNQDEGSYHQLYGVSRNEGCPYSLDNDINWSP